MSLKLIPVHSFTGLHKVEAEAGVRNEKSSKKRAASDLETVNTEPLVDNGKLEYIVSRTILQTITK